MENTANTTNTSKTATRQRQTAASSKSAQAFTIFKRHHGKKARREIVQEIVDKLGLAPSSANSYYQKFLHEGASTATSARRTSAKSNSSGSSGRGRPVDESSKAGLARAIFKKVGAKKPRKDVIQQLISQAGLTAAGASTYYQKLKHAA